MGVPTQTRILRIRTGLTHLYGNQCVDDSSRSTRACRSTKASSSARMRRSSSACENLIIAASRPQFVRSFDRVDRPSGRAFIESRDCFSEQPHLSFDIFGADVEVPADFADGAFEQPPQIVVSHAASILNGPRRSNRRPPEFEAKSCSRVVEKSRSDWAKLEAISTLVRASSTCAMTRTRL